MKMNLINFTVLVFMTLNLIVPTFAATNSLANSDFKNESFQKKVDFFDYARAANLSGIAVPDNFADWHANVSMTYVNTHGLQILHAGLEDITLGGPACFRMPLQSLIMHYKTDNRSRDVLVGSTFLMLLAFSENASSVFAGSPDVNDTLYASFSMGLDLSALNVTLPVLNSKTELLLLTGSSDKLEWSWGMRYTNLTAFWWWTDVSSDHPRQVSALPVAISVYDELTFNYTLKIDPLHNASALTENHAIGRMRDLLVWDKDWLLSHYNSTGQYALVNGSVTNVGNDTIYDYLRDLGIKMSIVNFQRTVLIDRETFSQTLDGVNVTGSDVSVSNGSVATFADDGERVCETDFGSKETYKLFNYSSDPSETSFESYNAVVRTTGVSGYAANTALFVYQLGLLKFLPLVVVNMFPIMYQTARATITNMSRCDYLYLVSYPVYDGYRVEHDPTLTAYLTVVEPSAGNPLVGLLMIVSIITIVAVAVFTVVRRLRKAKDSVKPVLQPAPAV